ncbi:MAG: thymidylate kinase, partial [Selenomonadaceae bacterium]|nr:thymidylate kinase [Selenomonadaceae bacterium]
MRGMLIVIEAGDGSGKATQTRKLYERLKSATDRPVHKISFPDYQSASSALIKMYLRGEFGSHASDVDAYAASTFYAVDRYASFKSHWRQYYEAGDIIITDRYVTSNMAHQTVKLDD